MKTIIAALLMLSIALSACASPIVTNAWEVDFDANAPIVLNVWRGDIRALTAQTGLTSLTNDAMFYWQSADMLTAWYETNATVSASGDVTAVWDSGMDAGDPYYSFFFRAGGVYCPRGTIKMQGSPGMDPHALPLPVQHIDFDLIDVLNAPWATPGDVATAFGSVVEHDPVAKPIAEAAYTAGTNALEQTTHHISRVDNPHGVTAEQIDAVLVTGDTMQGLLTLADTGAAWPDIATNVVYHVVVSNGHWLIQEVK